VGLAGSIYSLNLSSLFYGDIRLEFAFFCSFRISICARVWFSSLGPMLMSAGGGNLLYFFSFAFDFCAMFAVSCPGEGEWMVFP
jgi:hypothetical protein